MKGCVYLKTKFEFYYDETEHSRKINYKTIIANNYYDNFTTVTVGWKVLDKTKIENSYINFENKYSIRKSDGELKSTTIQKKQLNYGFASLNKENIKFISDLFALFDENIFLYFSVTSKIEYIILQLFSNYQSIPFINIDSVVYTIVKALILYQPQEILAGLYGEPNKFITLLKKFFDEKISQNKANLQLKNIENKAFSDVVLLLDKVNKNVSIDWNYNIAFWGFTEYLNEKEINKYSIFLDKEGGNSNTLNAALKLGLTNVIEVDSREFVGIRMADMLAGIISKFLKALHFDLKYKTDDNTTSEKLLNSTWFQVNEQQLNLYKQLKIIICDLNYAHYKSFAGIYADDLIFFVEFLNYMSSFETVTSLKNTNNNSHVEYFNECACQRLSEYYKEMHSN